ncbi:MAG: hypothetical protein KBG28_14670 [Kofleriaceae bacterium]|nr:hypothetical protein [Kofleriaceae bacterium]
MDRRRQRDASGPARLWPGLLLLLGVACRFDPAATSADAAATDPADAAATPADGASPSDGPSAVDAGVCTPRCDGLTAVTCSGGVEARQACSAGCTDDTAGPRCLQLVPANDVPAALVASPTLATISVAGGQALYFGDDGRIQRYDGMTWSDLRPAGVGVNGGIGFEVRANSAVGTGDLSVYYFGGLTIAHAAYVTMSSTRPLVVLTRGDIQIDGFLDGRAGYVDSGGVYYPWVGGPGGGYGGSTNGPAGGCAPGGNGQIDGLADSGGGGGGRGQAGAPGGSGGLRAGGAGGNVANCGGVEPLRGGSGGGGAARRGGGGGGAIQLTSLTRIRATTSNTSTCVDSISVSGAGGVASDNDGGGGGGSGGALLLEAPVIELAGARLFSLGGSGASGRDAEAHGVTGNSCLDSAAVGGSGDFSTGGNGGFSAQAPTAGSNNVDGGGGGGGGVGVIHLRTRAGGLLVSGDSLVAPAPAAATIETQ